MDRMLEQSPDTLLARINRELERISDVQHRLARRKSVLQEQATRLRLGVSAAEVHTVLRAIEVDLDERRPWPAKVSRELRPVEDRERYGGSLL